MVNKSITSMMIVTTMLTCGISFCNGCRSHEGDEDQLREDADSFATNYFNWHFERALEFCTPNSELWLRYMASNVNQEDVDSLRGKEEDATVEIKDITYHGDGDSATVTVTVNKSLQMTSIGKPPHRVDYDTFSFPATIHEGKWKIRMGSPLRSERQSHD